MKKVLLSTLLAFIFGAATSGMMAQGTDFNVVPRPLSVTATGDDAFLLNAQTRIYCGKSKAEKRNAQFLQQYLLERTGLNIACSPMGSKALNVLAQPGEGKGGNRIVLVTDPTASDNAEGYRLSVTPHVLSIKGASTAGTFYGIQTLRKALPHRLVRIGDPAIENAQREVEIPATEVVDRPRFAYRGAHLDVSRHYVTPDSIRRFIDMLALHNINRFHWHITDDQGWRLEIKKYPRLTEVGSKRAETVIGHNSGVYDGKPYGGYYTQKECREIVRYAAERQITIIPEIDMPGHMLGALAAYPELGCTGGPYDVWRIWGVSEDVLCAGNDRTLKFIDDVLDEVVKIFPSEYIHVGGDECPKTAWKSCPKCQARIKAEGLEARDGHSAEERLQSYIIRHAEAHLAKLGRKMIGWDETLEGGLADGATVMSWRGEEGGIEAARQHHDVVMTPNTYLYFDYYQSLDTEHEPEAIGGYLALDRVYSYEPVPESMVKEGIDSYIIGVQANLWTEYMPTYRQVEYMEMPRIAALADIQWTQRDTKDYAEFCQRTLRLMALYDEQGYNYAQHIYNVQADYGVDTENRCITAALSTVVPADIYYTLDGTEPERGSALYEGPIAITADAKLRACTFRPAERRAHSVAVRFERSGIEQADFAFNKATASPIVLVNAPAPRYTFAGAQTLVDGIHAVSTNFQSGQWLGFNGKDLEAIIDLGSEQTISSLCISTCVNKGDWIFNCRGLELATLSAGAAPSSSAYTTVAAESYPVDGKDTPDGIRTHTLNFQPVTARYIKVRALCEKSIPEWHTGKTLPAFLFVDEIVVK